jgi:hypothetical protein
MRCCQLRLRLGRASTRGRTNAPGAGAWRVAIEAAASAPVSSSTRSRFAHPSRLALGLALRGSPHDDAPARRVCSTAPALMANVSRGCANRLPLGPRPSAARARAPASGHGVHWYPGAPSICHHLRERHRQRRRPSSWLSRRRSLSAIDHRRR